MSKKQKANQVRRREAMAIVRERDRCCQFWLCLVVWAQTTTVIDFSSGDGEAIFALCLDAFPYSPPDCRPPLDGHEPKHRSQGGDPTDPDQIVLLCRAHHDWCHENPTAAKSLGL